MKRRYSLFGLLFGLAFTFAFAEGFLLIVKHFLSEDPEALSYYPYVRIGMYIFWTPFILKNIFDYLKEWSAHAAEQRLIRKVDKAKTKEARIAAQQARKAAKEAQKEARELEEERRRRDEENRAWQEKTTMEQRRQNAQRDQETRERAERYRQEKAREKETNKQPVNFCPHCGKPVISGARFCKYCGTSL